MSERERQTSIDGFGELREILHHAHDPCPFDAKHLNALLGKAQRDDPARYQESWLPYLERFGPDLYEVVDVWQLEKMVKLLPPNARFRLSPRQQHPNRNSLRELARSEVAEKLIEIDLQACSLDTDDLLALLDSRFLHELQTLELGENKLDDHAMSVFSLVADLPKLEDLSLWSNSIGPVGLEELLQAELPNLQTLDLGLRAHSQERRNPLGDEGVQMLREATWPLLQHLSLAPALGLAPTASLRWPGCPLGPRCRASTWNSIVLMATTCDAGSSSPTSQRSHRST